MRTEDSKGTETQQVGLGWSWEDERATPDSWCSNPDWGVAIAYFHMEGLCWNFINRDVQ